MGRRNRWRLVIDLEGDANCISINTLAIPELDLTPLTEWLGAGVVLGESFGVVVKNDDPAESDSDTVLGPEDGQGPLIPALRGAPVPPPEWLEATKRQNLAQIAMRHPGEVG